MFAYGGTWAVTGGESHLGDAGVFYYSVFGVLGVLTAMIIDWAYLGHDAPAAPARISLVPTRRGFAAAARF